MSIKEIIAASIAKNPVGMKEELGALLQSRLNTAIDAKRTSMAEQASTVEANEYNADSVDKAIASSDKNTTKKTTGKKKALIHALLKGHSKK